MHNAMLNLGGSKMAKSVGNTLLVSEVVKRVPPIALRYYLVAAHYRSIVEYSEEALLEAATAFERIEGFVTPGDRADRRGRCATGIPSAEFVEAMDDDLSTPAALAALQSVIAEGNKLLAEGDSEALRGDLASVRAMLDVLGLDPLAEPWAGAGGGGTDAALDSLVQALIAQREEARAAKDFATADRVRDQLAAAGIEVEDTAQGARWNVKAQLMAGNSKRRGAIKKSGKGNPTAGSGGRRRKGLEGKGPTPRAEERPYHKAHKTARAAERREASKPRRKGSERRPGVGGRTQLGRRAHAGRRAGGRLYVAEGIERDERIREIFRLAADQHVSLMEIGRVELDKLTGGAVHQGIAAKLNAYDYAHPDDLLALAEERGEPPLIVMLDGVTDPRNLGAVIRSASGFGAHGVVIAERRSAQITAAAWKSSAGAAARVPVSRVTNLTRQLKAFQEAGLMVIGLAADGDVDLPDLELGDGPLVVVIGSEGKGISRLVAETCDQLVSIPMSTGLESLNAGVAAGVALYAIVAVAR